MIRRRTRPRGFPLTRLPPATCIHPSAPQRELLPLHFYGQVTASNNTGRRNSINRLLPLANLSRYMQPTRLIQIWFLSSLSSIKGNVSRAVSPVRDPFTGKLKHPRRTRVSTVLLVKFQPRRLREKCAHVADRKSEHSPALFQPSPRVAALISLHKFASPPNEQCDASNWERSSSR